MEDLNLGNMMRKWNHLFKLDPAKQISDESIKRLCESNTDAIIVGGTDNITYESVLHLLSRLRKYEKSCILEVSTMDAIIAGFDYYFIPMVMNSKEKKWMMDIQHHAIKLYKDFMDWDTIFMEGYCILNEESKVFNHTNCEKPDIEDVVAYAYMAEHIFRLPIFYVEYSGQYGDPNLVNKVKKELDSTLLFYGGGIKTLEQAEEMKQFADVIVVGNSIYTDFNQALKTAEVGQNR